jgi:6-phosphogluconolactonase (cycloisomerase 2 family)
VSDVRNRWLYVESTSDGIHAYVISATGALEEVIGSPYAVSGVIEGLAIDRTSHCLYAVSSSSNAILRYGIDQTTGALTELDSNPTVGDGPVAAAINPAGNSLWVTDVGSNEVTIFTVEPDCSFAANPTTISTGAGSSPQAVTFSPDGEHAFVTLEGAGLVMSFYGVQDGLPPSVSTTSAVGAQPASVVVDPTSRYVYVTDPGTPAAPDDHIYAFAIDPTSAALTPLATPTFATGPEPFALAIDPSGSVLLATNFGSATGSGSLSAFTIGAGGVLTAVSPSTVGTAPRSVVITGTNR